MHKTTMSQEAHCRLLQPKKQKPRTMMSWDPNLSLLFAIKE
jgi:hypothetical protein